MKNLFSLFPSPYGVVSFNLNQSGKIEFVKQKMFPSPYGVVSFNRHRHRRVCDWQSRVRVSVPLRGSQFQSSEDMTEEYLKQLLAVSVPLRGSQFQSVQRRWNYRSNLWPRFPSPYGVVSFNPARGFSTLTTLPALVSVPLRGSLFQSC